MIIRRNRSSIRKGWNRAPTACCATARGSTMAGLAVLPSATSAFRPIAAATLAFALPEVIELKPSQGSGADQQPVGSRQIDNSGAHGGQAGDGLRGEVADRKSLEE